MRGVILGLHWYGGLTFKQIEGKVGVKKRTASELVKRAKVGKFSKISISSYRKSRS